MRKDRDEQQLVFCDVMNSTPYTAMYYIFQNRWPYLRINIR